MSSINPDTLKDLICQHISDAQVVVHCYSGDDHFEMQVVSAAFLGKSRVMRHKMVYAALGEHMKAAVHALALQTLTPEEASL